MRIFITLIIISTCICACQSMSQQADLAGEWFFALDPEDAGIGEQWFNKRLSEKIRLPGSLQEQGYGNDVDTKTQWTGGIIDSVWFEAPEYERFRQKGNIKIPFWLQPEKHYVGVAWYQREIDIPSSWKGKHVELELERAHWETTLYVNGKEAGKTNALQTPHRYVIDQTGKLMLSLRVDNRIHIDVGVDAHSVSDNTQTNWNGIIGNISLSAKPAFHIDDMRVYPDVNNRKASVAVTFSGKSSGNRAKMNLRIKSEHHSRIITKAVDISPSDPSVTVEMEMGEDMLTWSEFEPNLYGLQVELSSKEGKDTKTVTFGMREIKTAGTRFEINGIPVFFRGTLECAIFPLTGYPAMKPEYWQKIYRRCKEFGLNHVRFHSWCPPKVAFEVADREGIYLQVECGAWAWIGDGKPIDRWLYDESERIVKEYGNHPSFCMLLYGNEAHGPNHTAYLAEFVDYWKAKDSRRVYASSAGWPYIPNADFWNAINVRIQPWNAGLKSIINAEPPKTDFDFRAVVKSKPMPIISHEAGQWCVYPNYSEIPKYTGVLKARNFELFQQTLAEHHLGDLAEKFCYASGRLQTLCYKADIEAALRTPGFGGFQLLDLHDFPGQGTALVGVLDPFWDTKGYVDGKSYSMFCSRIVPLARMNKLVWTNDETFRASVEISHFDRQPLQDATIEWDISDGKKTLASKKTVRTLPVDNCIPVGDIEYSLLSIAEPAQLTLTVGIKETDAVNKWNFWVYPKTSKEISGKPCLTTDCNDALARAKAGGNVLYCIPKGALKADKGGDIKVGFSSIWWNTSYTQKQAPHTLGIFCDPLHPAFTAFPNEGYSDYQWWDVVTGSQAIVMDDFPAHYRPLVHFIDDWFTNRKLGLLFETKVSNGKMMVCSANLIDDLDKRPAARQFRYSLEQYMASGRFDPDSEIDPNVIKALLK